MKSITKKKIKNNSCRSSCLVCSICSIIVSAQESSTYTVKEGDTLSEIAETQQSQLLRNWQKTTTLTTIHMIYVGQELVIDGPVAPATTPAPTTYAAPAAETTEVVEEAAPVASAPAAEETVAAAELQHQLQL